MRVKNIEMLRDGGSILFELEGSKTDGYYKLQSPRHSNPRILLKEGKTIPLGSKEEQVVGQQLSDWLEIAITDSIRARMDDLDKIEWRNLPDQLQEVIPYHRIEMVVRVLNERAKR